MDATDNSARHSLYEVIGSPPPTPCVSQETSPVPAQNMLVDDSLVELEASQEELEALDNDAVSDKSMETSHEMSQLKKQLQSKKKHVQKAQKSAKIEQLHSQIAATDEQLAHLWQQSKNTNILIRKHHSQQHPVHSYPMEPYNSNGCSKWS